MGYYQTTSARDGRKIIGHTRSPNICFCSSLVVPCFPSCVKTFFSPVRPRIITRGTYVRTPSSYFLLAHMTIFEPLLLSCVEPTTCDEGPFVYGKQGEAYFGCQNRTDQGIACKPWKTTSIVTNGVDNFGTHNYCRNPSDPPAVATGKVKPVKGKFDFWCFTNDPDTRNPAWGYCQPGASAVTGSYAEKSRPILFKRECISVTGYSTSGGTHICLRVCAECNACNPGRYNNETGARSYNDCIKCDAGRYSPESAATKCTWCSQGQVQSDKGVRNLNVVQRFQLCSSFAHWPRTGYKVRRMRAVYVP